jgi:DNA-binding transcriptional MerR regulator
VVVPALAARMQKEESESEDESESEEESDSESEHVSQAPPGVASVRRSGAGAAALQVPGLTPQQIKKLLDLSSKAETMSAHKDIDKLQRQIAQLMSMREADQTKTAEPVRSRAASSSPPVNLKEIRELQKKLQELEKKTQNMPAAPQALGGGGGSSFMPAGTKVYTPTLVKDDPAFRKYFKLLDMSMPVDQIRAKMETEGVNPALLETPDAVSPNDPGVRGCHAYIVVDWWAAQLTRRL